MSIENEQTPVFSESEQREMLVHMNASILRELVDNSAKSATHLGGLHNILMGEATVKMPVAELKTTVNAHGQLMRLTDLARLPQAEQQRYLRVVFLQPMSIPGREAVTVNERFIVGAQYATHVEEEAKLVVRESIVRHNIEEAQTVDDLEDALELIKGLDGTTDAQVEAAKTALSALHALVKSDNSGERSAVLEFVTRKHGLRSKIDMLTRKDVAPELEAVGAAHIDLPHAPEPGSPPPGWLARLRKLVPGGNKKGS